MRLNNGHGFNLNQQFRPEQSWNLNRGTGRRIFHIDIFIANLPEFGQVREIEEVTVQLNYVVEAASGGLDRSLQIFKHLLSLSFEIVLAYNVPGFIESYLTGDKHNGSAPYDDCLRIAD